MASNKAENYVNFCISFFIILKWNFVRKSNNNNSNNNKNKHKMEFFCCYYDQCNLTMQSHSNFCV